MTGSPERYTRVAAALLFLVWFSGCATVIKGTDETISVMTDPAAAVCELQRGGSTIAVVNPTPGSVEVDRSKDDILVSCNLDEHEESTAVLRSEFTGFTIGNVLLGRVIGLGVDAASGANNEYPDAVSIIMIPKQFASEEQRDAVYAKLVHQTEERSTKLISAAKRLCGPDQERECEQKTKDIEEARDKELASIEEKRLRAQIVPP